jgi:CYTH domain-containing protein
MSQKYTLPEIERRWLVREDRVPSLRGAPRRDIVDRYIEGGRLRLRAVHAEGVASVFKLGKKYLRVGSEPERVVSIYLSQEEYELLQGLPGANARKARYSIVDGSIDVYEVPALRPILFSIENGSEPESAAYTPPDFVGEEVTFNAEYTGYALAISP